LSVLFADSSALARVYLDDEHESSALEALLLESSDLTVASELVSVELARAVKNAERGRRIPSAAAVLEVVDFDLQNVVTLIELDPSTILPDARELVLEHQLATLDAIHLAVAVEERRRSPDPVVFVTRDADQATAAKALGFTVL
jgi:predicted nucleic acid-binding protein